MSEQMNGSAGESPPAGVAGATPKDFLARVRKEILESGYPTELQASRVLEREGWNVYNNPVYHDEDENKLRETDLSATKSAIVSGTGSTGVDVLRAGGHLCMTHLIAECKRSKQPWVFFMRPSPDWASRVQIATPIVGLLPTIAGSESILSERQLRSFVPYASHRERAKTFMVPFTKGERGERPDPIWQALMQVTKATRHAMTRANRTGLGITIWFLPMVILDGVLLEARVSDDDVALVESQHVVVDFDFISPSDPSTTHTTLVDVVAKDSLASHVADLSGSHDIFAGELMSAFEESAVRIKGSDGA